MRVHDSQAYRKMDVTRARISRILELREILLSIQTVGKIFTQLEIEEERGKFPWLPGQN